MLNNWNDCDNHLREVGVIDLMVAEDETKRQEALLVVEQTYKLASEKLIARRAVLVSDLEAYYKANRKRVEAEGKRSIDLTFGRMGMRKGNPTLALMKGWKWDRVLAAIKERWAKNKDLLESLVNTKQSVNKDGCKSRLDEDQMALVGLKLKQDDEFYVEPFPEKARAAQPAP